MKMTKIHYEHMQIFFFSNGYSTDTSFHFQRHGKSQKYLANTDNLISGVQMCVHQCKWDHGITKELIITV